MSKRFTDTEKWEDPWFRKLPNEYKLLWLYLCDKCDVSGVWKVDVELIGHYIMNDWTFYNKEKCLEILKNRIHIFGDGDSEKWFILKFIRFQYGELSENSKPHQKVIALLKDYGLYELYLNTLNGRVSHTLPGGVSNTPKDKDKDKDKEKDKAKDKEKAKEKIKQKITSMQELCSRDFEENMEIFKIKYPGIDYHEQKRLMLLWIAEKPTRAACIKSWNLFQCNWLGRARQNFKRPTTFTNVNPPTAQTELSEEERLTRAKEWIEHFEAIEKETPGTIAGLSGSDKRLYDRSKELIGGKS